MSLNYPEGALSPVSEHDVFLSLLGPALFGFTSSCASDIVTNSLKVIMTTQQLALLSKTVSGKTSASMLSTVEALQLVVKADGVEGLFGRGLKTKLLVNALQGALFSVLLKYLTTTDPGELVPSPN